MSYLGSRSISTGKSAGSLAGAGKRAPWGAGAEAQVGVQGLLNPDSAPSINMQKIKKTLISTVL